ncbi:MAG: TetR/AcrR family transcriptional regulator [Wenzhouxiangellaceae bacterium]
MLYTQSMNSNASKPIGRPRIFDEETVLETILQQFWRHGYEATTLAHLTAATGLHKGSLYQAFGDKKTLFIKSLNHYLNKEYLQVLEQLLQLPRGLDQLRKLLHIMIEFATSDSDYNCGCMAVNTLVELAPHDPEILQVLEDAFAKRKQTVAEMIRAAQVQGQIKQTMAPEAAAQLVCTMIAGLSTSLKGILDEQQAHQVVEDFLSTLA